MRNIAFLLIVLLFISCNTSDEKEDLNKSKKAFVFDIQEPSEMTNLMLSMHDFNEAIKKEILAGKTPEEFPNDFLKIFTAELTGNKPYTDVFKAYSKIYVENEKAIFDKKNELSLKQRYNNAINTCISCHTTECTGPIPKIKKLLIK